MRSFSDRLEQEMQHKIDSLIYCKEDSVRHAEESVLIAIQSFDQLKASVKMKAFSSREEEIEFFKVIKPIFSSKLIYYNEIYRMEINKPVGDTKALLKYYNVEIRRINEFHSIHSDFYKYYRTQSTSMDKKYFMRRKHDIRTGIDPHFFQSDFDFNTTHDFLLARILANETLQIYLDKKKKEIKSIQLGNDSKSKEEDVKQLNWTGSKAALIELVYALHSSGVINNGNITLNKIAQTAESVFNIKLSQFNRVFLEIKNRKSIEQTAFLNQLKEGLLKRILESEK